MYIRIPLIEADSFNELPNELYSIGLEIPDGITDIRDVLLYSVIGDYVYVKLGIYNLKNKNRYFEMTDDEHNKWLGIIKLHQNWVLVEAMPVIPSDLI